MLPEANFRFIGYPIKENSYHN